VSETIALAPMYVFSYSRAVEKMWRFAYEQPTTPQLS